MYILLILQKKSWIIIVSIHFIHFLMKERMCISVWKEGKGGVIHYVQEEEEEERERKCEVERGSEAPH